MNKIKNILDIFLLLIIFLLCLGVFSQESHFSKSENIDKINFREPSGIAYHAERKTLFVVGDEGDICEIKTNGDLIGQKNYGKDCDFEGITYNPATGLLYVVVETKESIQEVDPNSLKLLRSFSIDKSFQNKKWDFSLEGITFVPNPKHSEGGTFFISNQSKFLDKEKKPSAIFEIEIPLKSKEKENKAKVLRSFSIGAIDLADMYYDQKTNNLFVISDTEDKLFETTLEGKVIFSQDLIGSDQEGITFDTEGNFYIAQDSGGILKMKILPKNNQKTSSSHH